MTVEFRKKNVVPEPEFKGICKYSIQSGYRKPKVLLRVIPGSQPLSHHCRPLHIRIKNAYKLVGLPMAFKCSEELSTS